MYFPIGWPKVLKPLTSGDEAIKQIVSNRDKILFAALTSDTLAIWFCKPCVPLVYHKRSSDSLERLGTNVVVEWKPDSSMICIATSEGHLVLYNVEVLPDQITAYQQCDPPFANLRRDSAELFVKEIIPPIKLVMFKEVMIWDGKITKLSCISGSEILVCTTRAHLLRYRWDGTQNRDYCLDLARIPFCINQQVSRAIPILEDDTYVSDIEYSPLVGGFGITLNDGRAAFLTSSTLKFDPNQVQGIWAQGIDDAVCASVNHKYRLIAIGRKNSQVSVFTIDETTGGLELSSSMVLSSKDFPGDPGAVRCMRWTGDGRALAVAWSGGGVSLWSTFGALLMCSLAWDYGLHQDLAKHNPLDICSMEWCTEGYQLWMVRKEEESSTSLIQLDFIKSALTVNPCMNHQSHLYLQADDRLYINLGENLTKNTQETADYSMPSYDNESVDNDDISLSQYSGVNGEPSASPSPMNNLADGKQWIILPLPATYSATNWPIRYSAIDTSGQNLAVAGRTGIAHYHMPSRRWKLFGNETQEKDFVVTGGMLWWRDYIVVGCFSILDGNDELRFYPREYKLDNRHAKVVGVQSQVLLMDMLDDQLVVFGADALVTIYELTYNEKGVGVGLGVELRCLQVVEVSALCVHPACVVSVALSRLQQEAPRPPAPPVHPMNRHTIVRVQQEQPHSLVLNVSGRLMMVQREESDLDDHNNPAYNCLPATVLASCVESVWAAQRHTAAQPHLTRALWLWCGAHGARVWLPLFPRKATDSRQHNFMAKRIMLPFHLKIYPLAILFEDAILLGAENDTVLYSSDSNSTFSLPFCVLNRTSQVYLNQILRQLLRRNLGYHAWEIARSCVNLPYFSHSLELLLHEVLEEEATSKEPIPDAQLPSVIEFIQEFPVYLQTVVQCARKTEIALWAYLFSAAGKPKELFQECLHRKMLDTAASYLIILQNLESSAVSRQLATVLLDTALQSERWDLARDLVRFLRAIDPNDVDSPRNSMIVQHKLSQVAPAPAVSVNAEDLSVILSNMQVNRGRSFSTTVTPRVALEHPAKSASGEPSAPASTAQPATATVKRKKSVPTARADKEACSSGGTAEEFFIDVMIQRHARRLLSAARLLSLGAFAARLDVALVSWLCSERERAARVDNATAALKMLHQDFQWPYPVLEHSLDYYLKRKSSGTLSSYSPPCQETDSLCGDSGYLSLPLRTAAAPITGHASPPAGGQAASVNDGDGASIAEGGSVWGDGPDTSAGAAHEERRYAALMEKLSHQHADKGSPRSEVQLRYFLQLMTEASCLEWSLLLAVVLRDAMAVLRTTNATRSNDISIDAVRRLKNCMQDLCAWVDSECLGYKPFMLAICNQIPFLTSVLNARERRQSLANSRLSSGSMTVVKELKENNQDIQESHSEKRQSVTEVSQQSVRRNSPKVVVVQTPQVSEHRSAYSEASTSKEEKQPGNCVIA